MKKKRLVSAAVIVSLLVPGVAAAQSQTTAGDSPQWLKDRQYNEGVGIRTGDLELHPGVAVEGGYDSNFFLRSDKQGAANGPPGAPVIQAATIRLAPSLYLSTIGPQRREGDSGAQAPSIAFRAGVNALARALFGLSGNTASENDVTKQDNIGLGAEAHLDILPQRPFGFNVFGTYVRTVLPNVENANPDLSFNRDDVGVGGEFVLQPGGGTLDWRFGYQFHDTIFETDAAKAYANYTHQAYSRGRWRFRPRTSLVYDASLGFTTYTNTAAAETAGLVSSEPVRARIGLSGLLTDRFQALALVGWGATFLDQTVTSAQPQYDSVIGQAELKWYVSASPGVAATSDLGLALSSVAVGYTRDFSTSYLGNYYGSDRGYLKFSYFFAGRALVTLEGGVAAVEYPNIYFSNAVQRSPAFTDKRVDATLFGEYRFTDTLGLNATLRYTANFSDEDINDAPQVAGAPPVGFINMAWSRFEAYLGVRWFM
ncbi:MAG: hypothetical protein ACRENE_16385 [Polyangiaceae bacterium]